MAWNTGVLRGDLVDNVSGDCRHHSDGLEAVSNSHPDLSRVRAYSNRDIFGRGKEPVDQHSHERRVQTELDGQFRQFGVCHTLRHDDTSNRNSGDQITKEPLHIVPSNPMDEGKKVDRVREQSLARREHIEQPFCRRRFSFDVRICRIYGESRFASSHRLLRFIAVLQLDAEDFGEAMAYFRRRGRRHVDRTRS